jgi:hypothetical protein
VRRGRDGARSHRGPNLSGDQFSGIFIESTLRANQYGDNRPLTNFPKFYSCSPGRRFLGEFVENVEVLRERVPNKWSLSRHPRFQNRRVSLPGQALIRRKLSDVCDCTLSGRYLAQIFRSHQTDSQSKVVDRPKRCPQV